MKNPFRLLPQGPLALVPTVLCTMAWISTLVQDGCDYAQVSGPSVEILSGSDVVPFVEAGRAGYRVPSYMYGPGNEDNGEWVIVYTDVCSSYGMVAIQQDWQWTFSRVARFITQTLGGSASLFLYGAVPSPWYREGCGASLRTKCWVPVYLPCWALYGSARVCATRLWVMYVHSISDQRRILSRQVCGSRRASWRS